MERTQRSVGVSVCMCVCAKGMPFLTPGHSSLYLPLRHIDIERIHLCSFRTFVLCCMQLSELSPDQPRHSWPGEKKVRFCEFAGVRRDAVCLLTSTTMTTTQQRVKLSSRICRMYARSRHRSNSANNENHTTTTATAKATATSSKADLNRRTMLSVERRRDQTGKFIRSCVSKKALQLNW